MATIAHAEAADAFDVVMSDCVFETPSPNCANATVTCVVLDAEYAVTLFNRACVVRNTVIDCSGGLGSFYGITATGGVGVILEMNRINKCAIGFFLHDGVVLAFPTTKDLIIRDNYLYDVEFGIWAKFTTDWGTSGSFPLGRMVITGNLIELSTTAGGPMGVNVTSTVSSPTNPIVEQLIVNRNIIRHVDGKTGSTTSVGVNLKCVQNAIVEENLINIGSSPDNQKGIIRDSSVKKIKAFDNQSTAGVFLGSWNGASHDGDLVTDIEDMMIGLL